MLEWLAAVAVFVLLVALLPGLLRRTKASQAKSGAAGVWIGIGLAFATMFNPRIAQAIEQIEKKQDEAADEESGDKP